MPDTLTELAFDESARAIDQQAGVLDGLRSRAGTLLAAASLVTSFLGGQALAKPTLSAGAQVSPAIGTLGWVAVGCFVGIAVLTLAVLWPREWRFVMSAQVILDARSVEGQSVESVQADLATYNERNFDSNQEKLELLFWFFRGGCALLVVETVAWILDLAS